MADAGYDLWLHPLSIREDGQSLARALSYYLRGVPTGITGLIILIVRKVPHPSFAATRTGPPMRASGKRGCVTFQ
jgi:hypothetical protein